jgi:hypothetical protein
LDALIESFAGFPDGQTEKPAGLGVTHRVDFLHSCLQATGRSESLHGRDQFIDSLGLRRMDGKMREHELPPLDASLTAGKHPIGSD